MNSKVPTVFIIVPAYNRRAITMDFAECLRLQTYQNFKLCLVDDGSTDGTADAVRSIIPSVHVIQGNGDLWWAGSLQKGYEWVKSQSVQPNDIIVVTNDDAFWGPKFLEDGLELLKENPNSAICGQYFNHLTGELLDRGAKCNFTNFTILPAESDDELTFLSTRGLFVWGKDFLNSGGFYPNKLPHYLSDYEFTYRLHDKVGLKLLTSSKIPVFGRNDQSGESTLDNLGLLKSYKRIFSKRYHSNPTYLTNFVNMIYGERPKKKVIVKIWLKLFSSLFYQLPLIAKLAIGFFIYPIVGIIRGFLFLTHQEKVKKQPFKKVSQYGLQDSHLNFLSLIELKSKAELENLNVPSLLRDRFNKLSVDKESFKIEDKNCFINKDVIFDNWVQDLISDKCEVHKLTINQIIFNEVPFSKGDAFMSAYYNGYGWAPKYFDSIGNIIAQMSNLGFEALVIRELPLECRVVSKELISLVAVFQRKSKS